jgi:hypothetical protein
MPRLNQVFEELGVHHGEYVVPPEVLASIEKKKAATKNVTAAAESKKRRGQVGPKVVSKKQKTAATSAAPVPSPATSSTDASASAEEDTVGEHGASATEEAPGAFVAGGEGAPEVPVTSVVDPFPSVLGGDSSPDTSEASQRGDQSPAKYLEVPASSSRRRVAEVSEDEGDSPDAARVMASASFPLLYSKGVVLLIVLAYFSFPLLLCFGFVLVFFRVTVFASA